MPDAPPTISENESKLNGLRKAAILLLSMDAETSAKVVQLLPRHSVEEVTREIASIDLVNPDTSSAVITEFYNLALARRFVEQGGILYASQLLHKSLNKEDAERILKQI